MMKFIFLTVIPLHTVIVVNIYKLYVFLSLKKE